MLDISCPTIPSAGDKGAARSVELERGDALHDSIQDLRGDWRSPTCIVTRAFVRRFWAYFEFVFSETEVLSTLRPNLHVCKPKTPPHFENRHHFPSL